MTTPTPAPSPEAVEAAARALCEHRMGRKLDAASVLDLERATAALTAAYPLIAAQALRDAVAEFESNVGVGEFDEQTRRNDTHHTHSAEAWEHQSAYMDWLLNRADQIEREQA